MITKEIKNNRFEAAAIWSEQSSFEAHAHDEFVLSCNIVGHETLRLDGRAMEAPQFATTLYNPGQIQSGTGTELIGSLYLDQTYLQQALFEEREVVFDRHVVQDNELRGLFAKVISSVMCDNAEGDLDELVNTILLISTQRYSNRGAVSAPRNHDWRIKHILVWLRSDLSHTPSLDAMATEVGLSKTAFLRMFKNAVGTTPSKWHRYQRLAEAKRQIKYGGEPTNVAQAVGFFDQAHLIKHFKKAYGVTPGHFARLSTG